VGGVVVAGVGEVVEVRGYIDVAFAVVEERVETGVAG
jgi:hypothetical protein